MATMTALPAGVFTVIVLVAAVVIIVVVVVVMVAITVGVAVACLVVVTVKASAVVVVLAMVIGLVTAMSMESDRGRSRRRLSEFVLCFSPIGQQIPRRICLRVMLNRSEEKGGWHPFALHALCLATWLQVVTIDGEQALVRAHMQGVDELHLHVANNKFRCIWYTALRATIAIVRERAETRIPTRAIALTTTH